MTNPIVTVNVAVVAAPTPSTLQQTGALISVGATNTAANTKTLLTKASDLTAILAGTAANSTLTWSASVVTVTTAAPHGLVTGDILQLTIAGVTPSGYNGTFTCTVTSASTFTYPLVSNPGAETVPGTWTAEDVAELNAMVTTFFAQGNAQAVYVLELGDLDVADAVTALSAYIVANVGAQGGPFYAYLVPRTWDSVAGFLSFVANFEAVTSKTYFFVTTTTSNYTNYTAQMKCVYARVEAPGIPSTEFTQAAAFFKFLSQQPSPTNKVTQMAFSFQFGVTSYPLAGNSAVLTSLANAFVNYTGTGAEGGISTAAEFFGTTMDGKDALKWWYGVDWAQINSDLAISNAIINGSNNSQNPLYYNQDGVNRLQGVVSSLMNQGIAAGIVLGQVVLTQLDQTTFNNNVNNGIYANQTAVNAVPFVPYSKLNPSDYAIGKYSGLSVAITPQLGFKQIVFNLTVTSFVAGS
jgi:hypothetical protein